MSGRDANRGSELGRALEVVRFLQHRRVPFLPGDLAVTLGCCQRTAQRWLAAAFARGLVERHRTPHDRRFSRWHSRIATR